MSSLVCHCSHVRVNVHKSHLILDVEAGRSRVPIFDDCFCDLKSVVVETVQHCV